MWQAEKANDNCHVHPAIVCQAHHASECVIVMIALTRLSASAMHTWLVFGSEKTNASRRPKEKKPWVLREPPPGRAPRDISDTHRGPLVTVTGPLTSQQPVC